MKEFTNIHLARTPFMIEPEARRQLADYLEDVQAALGGTEDDMMEIELRIAEILHEQGITKDRVIIQRDIDIIVQQLGSPSAFYSSIDEEAQARRSQEPQKPLGFWGSINRRFALFGSDRTLLRDTNRSVLFGVLAGIGARYNIPVVLLRILAVLLSFASLGLSVLAYILLTVIIPPTKSTADRLALKGLPLTRTNLQCEAFIQTNTLPGIVILRVFGFIVLLIVLIGITALAAGVAGALFHGEIFSQVPAKYHGFVVMLLVLYACITLCFFIGILLGMIAIQKGKLSLGMRKTLIACLIASSIIFASGASLFLSMMHSIDDQRHHVIEQTKEQTTVQLAGLADAKSLALASTNSKPLHHVTYKELEAGKEPYMEVTSLRGQKTLTAAISAEEHGTRLALSYDGACSDLFTGDACTDEVSATIYGPKLSAVTWDTIAGNYYTTGSNEGRTMDVTIKHEGALTLRAKGMTGIEAEIDGAQYNQLTIEGTVENIGITGQSQGAVTLDNAKQVAIKTSGTCQTNRSQLSVTYRGQTRPEKISHNEHDVVNQEPTRQLYFLATQLNDYYLDGEHTDCQVLWREKHTK